jgi:peptidoglycan hydrolase-like protein with peptidoglycan-binding domain
VANVSYLRPLGGERSAAKSKGATDASPGRFRRGRYFLGAGILLVVGVVAAAALVLVSARASLTTDPVALANVGLPLGGGSIESVKVVTGPHQQAIPVEVRGDKIWPVGKIPADEVVSIAVVVKRPGWVSWLAGKTQQLRLSMRTPVASLHSHYLTVRARAPLRLRFKAPIRVISYGPAGALERHVLDNPQSTITIPRGTPAGTMYVSAAPRIWESSKRAMISWFPAGAAATAVADPAPGTQIEPGTPITLTFSKPLARALGPHRPPVSPSTQGSWHTLNSHTIVFRPEGYGYGLGAKVSIALPGGVRLVGGQQTGTSDGGTWIVPAGSTVRLQQLLASLGYLPLRFTYAHHAHVALTPQAQEAAAVKPPAGKFTWLYKNTPSALVGFWQPGASGVVTSGALMAFENTQGMTADGIAGPTVWRALMNAEDAGHRSTFGYTFVSVSEGSPESLSLWHSGKIVLNTPVNTGIPEAPTATGTYPVYEHLSVTTMSGTNPDGSTYSDPGIPWVSYFNGGDALHGFIRSSYGSPQSLGCVEMPYSTAGAVYPYTPIGTLVNVS